MSKNSYSSPGRSELYLKYHPKYSDDVARYVINYPKGELKENEKLDLMIEVGCGTGQATNVFAPFFKQVLATDVSPEQVRVAAKVTGFNHVTYSVTSAEDLPFEDSSEDLVLICLSAHLYDLPKFFAEAQRVLKPGGCIAVIGYAMKGVSRAEPGQPVHDVSQLYTDFIVAGSKEPTSLLHDDLYKYKKIFNLMPWSDKTRNDNFKIELEMESRELEDLEKSYGVYEIYERRYMEKIKNGENNVSKSIGLAEGLRKLVGVKYGDDIKLKLIYEVFVLTARVH